MLETIFLMLPSPFFDWIFTDCLTYWNFLFQFEESHHDTNYEEQVSFKNLITNP